MKLSELLRGRDPASDWLRRLPPLPAAPTTGVIAGRWVKFWIATALLAIPALTIVLRALPKDSTAGRLLYGFHDEVLLRAWAYGWRQYYPWSLAFWVSVALIGAAMLWVWLSTRPVTRQAHVWLQRRALHHPAVWPTVRWAVGLLQRRRWRGKPWLTHTQLRALAEAEWQGALARVSRVAGRAEPAANQILVQLTRVRIDLLTVCPDGRADHVAAAALWHGTMLQLDASGDGSLAAGWRTRGRQLAEAWRREVVDGGSESAFGQRQLMEDFAACVAWREETPEAAVATLRRLAGSHARRVAALEEVLRRVAGSRFRVVQPRPDLLSTLVPAEASAAPLAVTVAIDLGVNRNDPELAWRLIELMDAVLLAARFHRRQGPDLAGLAELIAGWGGRAPSAWHRRLAADRLGLARDERWRERDYLVATGFSPADRAAHRVRLARTQAALRWPTTEAAP